MKLVTGNIISDIMVWPKEFDKFKFFDSNLLNSEVQLKEKHNRSNQVVFMNKELCKTITVQTHLNKFEKSNCSENHSAYKMQYTSVL